MHASTILSVAILAVVAVALPKQNLDHMTVGAEGNSGCGNGQVVSCCNKSDAPANSNSGILPGLDILGGLLGGNCSPLDISALTGAAVPINHACSGNQAACCTGSMTGLINIGCNQFTLFKK